MHFLLAATLTALVSLVSGQVQPQTLTGAFDCLPAGAYTLCQNQWGASKWSFYSSRWNKHGLISPHRCWSGVSKLHFDQC